MEGKRSGELYRKLNIFKHAIPQPFETKA